MWSWLQKLMSVFRGEEREMEADEMHPTHHANPRQLQAKTKSIYPKERESTRANEEFRAEENRHFRFPVVPDHYPERRRVEKELGLEPLEGEKGNPPLSSERKPNRKPVSDDTNERIRPTKEEPARKKQMDKQAEENRFAKKQPTELPKPSRPLNTRTAGIEKRTYQPSDIVSPVFGKITPATMEMEHRIHTTAGIVYPLQEQEEHLNQLKLWQQMQMEGKGNRELQASEDVKHQEEVAAASEPLFLFTRNPQPPVAEAESEQEAAMPADHLTVPLEVQVQAQEDAEASSRVDESDDEEGGVPSVESEVEQVETLHYVNDEDLADEETVFSDTVGSEVQAAESEFTEEVVEVVEVASPITQPWQSPELACLLERADTSPLTTVEEEVDSADETAAPDEMPSVRSALTPMEYEPVPELLESQENPDTAPEPEVESEPELKPIPEEMTPESPSEKLAEADYQMPTLELLNPSPELTGDDEEHTQLQKLLLEETLANFNVSAQVVGIVKGPSVTRFELQPAPGVKVNKITGLVDDIKLNLAAKDIRIEAPIPGRNAIGIEVPNLSSQPVLIEKIIGSAKFQQHPSPLAVALGMDIGGEPIIADIKKMPHGLIAGATGSGKSVCINSIIVSLLYKATPEQVRLLLIDPKMVELAPYNHLPHLVTPVVTEAKQATAALKWAVEEMEKRYALFVDAGVRDIERYNQTTDDILPYIVIVIDELADLMMVSPQDVEDCIIRIAQKARACGIHLLLATQRPSVDVITGNIKANVPTRLAFAVFSQVDSRTILDQSGAERLLGRGDMLFLESGTTPLRLQGNFVTDDEIERITHTIKKQRKPAYLFSKEDLEQQVQSFDAGDDPLYLEALVFVAEQGQASASGLQRRFRVGYNRAARLIEMMEADGYVAGQSGGKARAVLITLEDAQAVAEGSTLL